MFLYIKEEISLSNKVKLLALECIQNDSKKLQVVQTLDDIVSAHVEDLGKVCVFIIYSGLLII